MKYVLGIVILIFGIYVITDLAIQTRSKRKRLENKKGGK